MRDLMPYCSWELPYLQDGIVMRSHFVSWLVSELGSVLKSPFSLLLLTYSIRNRIRAIGNSARRDRYHFTNGTFAVRARAFVDGPRDHRRVAAQVKHSHNRFALRVPTMHAKVPFVRAAAIRCGGSLRCAMTRLVCAAGWARIGQGEVVKS